jgi:hypothetical protein
MSSSNGAVSAGFHILAISVLHRRNGNQSYNAFRHHSLRGPRLLTTRRPAPGFIAGLSGFLTLINRNGFERPTSRAPGFPAILEVILGFRETARW